MPGPWLMVGKLVLNNLDSIIGVVKPAFTRKKADAAAGQTELINQQIAELQTAAANNAEQTRQLAAQLKELVTALEQAAIDATTERRAARRVAYVALGMSIAALVLAAFAWFG